MLLFLLLLLLLAGIEDELFDLLWCSVVEMVMEDLATKKYSVSNNIEQEDCSSLHSYTVIL